MDYNLQSVNTFNRAAERYQEKYMDLSLYIETFSPFVKALIRDDAHVLELACGPGNITRYLLTQKPELTILATDLAPNMLSLAKKNNPKVEVMLLDSRDLQRLERRFDAIMCGFCLPYLNHEEAIKLINDAAEKLNPNGVLYLSTMEGDETAPQQHISSDGDHMYTYLHQGQVLTDALEAVGFSLIEIKRKQQDSPIGEVIDLFITARLDNE